MTPGEFFFITSMILVAITIVSINWTTLMGAPYLPSTMRKVRRMLKLANIGPDDVVYDLGSGDGRIVIAAARLYGAQAVGVEVDPFRYGISQLLKYVFGVHRKVKFYRRDFFKVDLSEATVVTSFLFTETNTRLLDKLADELKPGTRIISNHFEFPNWLLVDEYKDVYVYEIKGSSHIVRRSS